MNVSVDHQADRQDEINRLLERFASEFKRGQRPSIENFILSHPAARTALLQKLISLEWKLRVANGEHVDVDEYRRRFPEDSISWIAATPTARITADISPVPIVEEESPQICRLGRYEIQRILGHGGFGIVYLAFDPQLDRPVALKIPRRERFENREDIDRFLLEARTAAKLKHPMLVAVYDVQDHGDMVFIVQEYVESRSLAEWCVEVRPSFEQIARVMINVAEAVGYMHQQGLIHCDLKPANVLMDKSGQPHVSDFGLATHESRQSLIKGQRFGTPTAMAPEQVRGESHLMDGRTDIWALGVMFYQLLTGRLPFVASNNKELFELIRAHDPTPPRQYERRIPKELERICLKCLARQRADRFNTAEDLRDDLLSWFRQDRPEALMTPAAFPVGKAPLSAQSEVLPNIVPKGLRAYDAEDADFFLALLPGPQDREGLPDSLRFWRNRVQQRNPDQTFPVGLMYGPSGCGKSSLVKAGLLPRVGDDVIPIYIEAAPDDTETRILLKLRHQFPSLSADASLPDVCAELRMTRDAHQAKILLVIDQFEQWLHAHPQPRNSAIVDALRQCDGEKLQAILMVRDDFFLSVNRVFKELEIRLQEGVNCSMVDFFDVEHSRKVLTFLGRAYGKLGDELSALETTFLAQAVNDLAENRKVVCVQLVLFADMMKSRPWIPSSLEHVGGARGVGVAMLDETFSPQTAPISYRLHDAAIRRVLKSLLPSAGTDIKGAMQPAEHLREIAGYAKKPQEFDELIQILDSERRLITPTDGAGIDTSDEKDVLARYYQLTHDYLVPSLRTWLARKQSERMRGRLELRLADIAADWSAKPGNKRLPSLWEFISIRLLTNAATWSTNERQMMRTAAGFHGKRGILTLTVMMVLIVIGWKLVANQRHRLAVERGESRRKQAEILLKSVLEAPPAAVPFAVRDLESFADSVLPSLRDRFSGNSTDAAQRSRAAVLLAQLGEPPVEFLVDSVETASKQECSNVIAALKTSGQSALEQLQERVARAESSKNWRLKSRLALTLLQLGDPVAAQHMAHLSSNPVERATFIDTVPQWCGRIESLLREADRSDSGEFRSAVLLGLGSVPREELQASELAAAAEKISQWYLDMPDSGTHSAAEWALRRWQYPLPKIGSSVNTGASWQINSLGMTMVRIPASGNQPAPGAAAASSAGKNPGRSFLICDREVSRRTFQMFIDDDTWPASAKPMSWPGSKTDRSPSDDHPVQRVSWVDAVLFCNWLSHRERRNACYAWNGTEWILTPGANGYRLPTSEEWEYAGRAGTSAEFICGNDESLLENYAVYQSNQAAVCGSKMPGPSGLFDMHGNVYEWCQDKILQDHMRALRSGAFEYSAALAGFSNIQSNTTNYRSFTIGMRVARDED